MATATIQPVILLQNSAAVFMARIVKDDGEPATQSDLATEYGGEITVTVTNADTEVSADSQLLGVDENIFDELQTNAAWTVDTTGYNFRMALPGSNWPVGDTTYQIEVRFVAANGDPFLVVWSAQTLKTFSGGA